MFLGKYVIVISTEEAANKEFSGYDYNELNIIFLFL